MIKVYRTDVDEEFDDYVDGKLDPDWELETLTVRSPRLQNDDTKRWMLEGRGNDLFNGDPDDEFLERLDLFNNVSIILEDGTEFKYRKSLGDDAYKIGLELKNYLENKNTCVLQDDDTFVVQSEKKIQNPLGLQ